jgi:carboxymethylenebutenolidase
VDMQRTVYSCPVNGHEVGVESFSPTAPPGPLPLVLLLHGRDGPDGVAGDRGYRDLGRAVAGGGFRVLLPHYFDRTRDGEPDRGDGGLDQIGREVEHYGLWLEAVGGVLRASRESGQRVGLVGFSLGGYLALTRAMAWREVAAVAVCYSGIPAPFADLAASLPPTLVLHGGEDRVIPVGEALALAQLLRRHCVHHELHVYPHAGHGFSGADAEDAVGRVLAFFHKHLDAR